MASVPSNYDENCVKQKLNTNCLSEYSTFITEGYVSLVGSNKEVPVTKYRHSVFLSKNQFQRSSDCKCTIPRLEGHK